MLATCYTGRVDPSVPGLELSYAEIYHNATYTPTWKKCVVSEAAFIWQYNKIIKTLHEVVVADHQIIT
jgi:hypothetical protein